MVLRCGRGTDLPGEPAAIEAELRGARTASTSGSDRPVGHNRPLGSSVSMPDTGHSQSARATAMRDVNLLGAER
jgi:hypothetical protein